MRRISKGTTKREKYGLNSSGDFTPYFYNEKFVSNLVTGITDPFHSDKRQRKDLAYKLQDLRKNKGRFLCFYCRHKEKNPFNFLGWVHEQGYTLEIHGELFCDNGDSVDFHGNLRERSSAFMFRIYDFHMVKELQEITSSMPQHVHFARSQPNN